MPVATRRWIRLVLAGAILLPSLWLLTPSHRYSSAGSVAGRPVAERAKSGSSTGDVGAGQASRWTGQGSLFDDEPDFLAQDKSRGWLSSLGIGSSSSRMAESNGKSAAADGNVWINFEEQLPLSVYEGGLPGYSVFSNLYVSSGGFMFVSPSSSTRRSSAGSRDRSLAEDGHAPPVPDEAPRKRRKPLPKPRQIISGNLETKEHNKAAGEEWWREVEDVLARDEVGKRGLVYKGVTYIFIDGAGQAGYLVYYKHFVLEAFLGAARTVASAFSSVPAADLLPRRVWFPRCGRDPSWRDQQGENNWFLSHALPMAPVEDSSHWEDRTKAGITVLLEKVIIIDRWAAHSMGGESAKWGKMNADVPSLPTSSDFWDPFRRSIMTTLGVEGDSTVGRHQLPIVVYVDRQRDKPRLSPADHDALIEALKRLTHKAEIHVAKLTSMKKAQQMELMGRAEIVVGVHSDDLSHALWMQDTPRSTMIELFEEGGYDHSWRLLATVSNHDHIVIHNNRILPEEEWRAIGNKRGAGEKGDIPIDPSFVARVVEQALDRLDKSEASPLD